MAPCNSESSVLLPINPRRLRRVLLPRGEPPFDAGIESDLAFVLKFVFNHGGAGSFLWSRIAIVHAHVDIQQRLGCCRRKWLPSRLRLRPTLGNTDRCLNVGASREAAVQPRPPDDEERKN